MVRDGKANANEWRHVFELLEYTAKTGLFVKKAVLDSLKQLGLEPKDVGVHFKR